MLALTPPWQQCWRLNTLDASGKSTLAAAAFTTSAKRTWGCTQMGTDSLKATEARRIPAGVIGRWHRVVEAPVQ